MVQLNRMLIVVVAMASLGQVAKALVLVNPGFELPDVGVGFMAYVYAPVGSGLGWTFSTGAGVSANNTAFTFGNPVAPEGVQVGFLQNANSSISQSIPGFIAGTYAVNFRAAQRGAGGFTQPSTQDFTVDIDGMIVGAFQPNSINYDLFTTAPVDLLAGSHTLTFTGLNSLGASDVTVFLDGISINPVPEPSGLLLIGTGIAATWGLRWRRERKSCSLERPAERRYA